MERIKILELLDTYYPIVDGAINAVHNYAEHLNKVADCDLAVPSADKKLHYVDKDSFNVYRCKSMAAPENYRLATPGSDKKFQKKLLSNDYDIIHAQSPFSMGRFAVKLAKMLNVPMVASLHTKYYDDFLRSTKSKLLAKIALSYIMWVFKKADYVWTVSPGAAKTLREYGYKGNIDVIKNGTDMVYPTNDKELINQINDKHNLHGKKNVFLFVGRMAMYKNLKLLCDGLKVLQDNGGDYTMIFVGGGFDYTEIVEYTKKIGINDNCIFTGEVRDRGLIQAYFLRADLLLFPSTFDTSGLVGIEAAIHKTPALFINGSNAADGVTDDVNGFLCEENKASFGKKLIEITAKGEDFIKEIGENACRDLSRTWQDVADEVIEKYKKIIDEHREKQVQASIQKKNKKLKKLKPIKE